MKPKTIVITAIFTTLVIVGGFFFFNRGTAKHGKTAYKHTQAILAVGPRPAGSDGLKKAQQYISRQLAQSGWKTFTQTIVRDTPKGKRTFINLIARYDSGDVKNIENIIKLPTKGILCAHLDSKEIPNVPEFLGADDAASACALIIELATTLAKENPELAKHLELVFFDGEEAFAKRITLEPQDGLYGSRAYSTSLYKRNPKPTFGILLDMIGHKNLHIAVPGDTPPHLYETLIQSAEQHDAQKHYSKMNTGVRDDHYYLNKAGVPTIDIIGSDFTNSNWWHKKGDTIENISPKSLTTSYHVTLTMLRKLLSQ